MKNLYSKISIFFIFFVTVLFVRGQVTWISNPSPPATPTVGNWYNGWYGGSCPTPSAASSTTGSTNIIVSDMVSSFATPYCENSDSVFEFTTNATNLSGAKASV